MNIVLKQVNGVCVIWEKTMIYYTWIKENSLHTLYDRRIFEKRDGTDGKGNSF